MGGKEIGWVVLEQRWPGERYWWLDHSGEPWATREEALSYMRRRSRMRAGTWALARIVLADDRDADHLARPDPPAPSLRDEVRDAIQEAYHYLDTGPDMVLAVVRKHVEALGHQPQPRHGGDPHSWSAGWSHCYNDVLGMLGASSEEEKS